MKEVSLFIKQVVKQIMGDDAEAKAIAIQRTALSSVKLKIAHLDCVIQEKEDDLITSKENYEKSLCNNGELIGTDKDGYISRIVAAKNRITEAEEELNLAKEEKEMFTEILSTISK